MFKHLLKSILISVLLNIWFCPAQSQQDIAHKLRIDSARIKPYSVSGNTFDKYYSSKHFQYLQEKDKNPSFWTLLWQKFLQLLGLAFATKTGSFIMYAFFVLAFIFFIAILSGADMQSIMQRNPKLKGENFYTVEYDSDNLDNKLQTALKNRDFTEAIRLFYLITLHKLDKIQLITWHKDKTNRDYLLELNNTRYFESFSKITKIYEYIWYGKFPVTQAEYAIFEKDFVKMKDLLNAK